MNHLTTKYISKPNKGNSSIPLFEIHKSIEKKASTGYKLKLRETHQMYEENYDTTETRHKNVTHRETNYNIKMAIFLKWYRKF